MRDDHDPAADYDNYGSAADDEHDDTAADSADDYAPEYGSHAFDADDAEWYGEAWAAQYDDDPSPYDGTYSED